MKKFKLVLTRKEARRIKRLGIKLKRISPKEYFFLLPESFEKERKKKQKRKKEIAPSTPPLKGVYEWGFIHFISLIKNTSNIDLNKAPIIGKVIASLIDNFLLNFKNDFLLKSTSSKDKKIKKNFFYFSVFKVLNEILTCSKELKKYRSKFNFERSHLPSASVGALPSSRHLDCFASQRFDKPMLIKDKNPITRKSITSKPKVKAKRKSGLFKYDSYDFFCRNLLEKICNLGYPFTKHHQNSKIYKETLALLKKHYKKDRANLFEIFSLAKEYFTNPDFIYHPKQLKVIQFFKYSPIEIARIPTVSKLNVVSWYSEFSKGRDYIEAKFMKVQKDKYPELTKVFTKYWLNFSNKDEPASFERRHLIMFCEKIVNYAKIKKISARTIFDVINRQLFKSESPLQITSPTFFNSKYFIETQLPKLLIDSGVLKASHRKKGL
jgi:hypothetical protein